MISITEIKKLNINLYNRLVSEIYFNNLTNGTKVIMDNKNADRNIKALKELRKIYDKLMKLENESDTDKMISIFLGATGTISLTLKTIYFTTCLRYFNFLIKKDFKNDTDKLVYEICEDYRNKQYRHYVKFKKYGKVRNYYKRLESRLRYIYNRLEKEFGISSISKLEENIKNLQSRYEELYNKALNNLKAKQKSHLNHQEV